MRRFAALALAGAALAARASVTNVVDVAALQAIADNSKETCTNGWTLFCIDTYADSSLQFNAKDDWMRSPEYGADIVGVVATVRCSATNATRWVSVVDDGGGAELARFAACSKADTLQEQSLSFAAVSGVRRIKFKFGDGGSGSTRWGIGALSVITADAIAAPAALAVVKTNMTSCVLEWVNDGNVVSNRVDTYQIERGAGETTLCEVDFSRFSAGGNTVRMDALLPEIDSLLSGTNVYAAVNTNGICQVGKGDALGIIRWAGVGDFCDVSLKMSAKRYPGDNAETIVAYEVGGSTNAIATLVLTDEFAEYTVDLSKDANGTDVPSGAAILIGYYTKKSNRRVLIDSLSIVRTGVDKKTLVDSRWIPASQGVASFSTKGAIALPPKANCRFVVFSQNADGCISEGATVETRLGEVTGFGFILR